jgi:hypothetical protein
MEINSVHSHFRAAVSFCLPPIDIAPQRYLGPALALSSREILLKVRDAVDDYTKRVLEDYRDMGLLVRFEKGHAQVGPALKKKDAQRPVGRRLVELLPDGRQFAGQTTRVAKPELSGMSRLRGGQSTLDACVRPFHRTTLHLRLRTQESAVNPFAWEGSFDDKNQ